MNNTYEQLLESAIDNPLSLSQKQNILGELYNKNLKDLKAEYKLTKHFEHTLHRNIVLYINILFLKYGKIFIEKSVPAIEKDNKISIQYFKKSAKKHNLQAQYNLAMCYYYGIGVTKNYSLAFKYFEKSANQNNPKAQYALAIMYLEGKSVEENIIKAIHYFTQAIKHKHKLAIIMLSAIYKFGIKCKINDKKSKDLLSLLKK